MKKNKIFKNEIVKKIDNNQKSFNIIDSISNNSITNNNLKTNNKLSVREKINMLLNRNGYIFNVSVEIITENKNYKTKIAGKVMDNLITLDNDIIAIKDIKDIIINN